MNLQKRLYEGVFREHLSNNRQMCFVSGARQVGKTTTCRTLGDHYLDWDNWDHQRIILSGPAAVAEFCQLNKLRQGKLPVVVFDEIHKYARWKNFLKGFFDVYADDCRIIVTGSSRLDLFKRGGDSLMGRYFPYHMHPLTVSELLGTKVHEGIHRTRKLSSERWNTLWTYGGYPEPFLKANSRHSRRWQALRSERLFKEDLRDLTRVQELGLLEILGRLLADRSGEQLVYANLAKDIQVSSNTIKSWVRLLTESYYGFLVRPWYKNITKSLRKEPKWYLRDWAGIDDPGKKAETFTACHLLKAVNLWTDLGLGQFDLCYLRDKQKREVDFIVIKDNQPWFLVEVKYADSAMSPALEYFQKQTHAEHAFQVIITEDYIGKSCFDIGRPVIVPAKTFLSELI